MKSLVPAVLLALLAGAATAQERADVAVQHWALAPFLGTGVYNFDNQESVFLIEYAPTWILREGSLPGASPRRARLELLLPAALGLSNFDLGDLPESLDPGNIATFSLVPGIKATFEMNERWTLRGTANLGGGARLDGEEKALIYRAGVRTRYRLGPPARRWNLIAALDYIGYDSDRDRQRQLLPLTLAVEFELGIDAWAMKAGPTRLVTHISASHYLDELSLNAIDEVRSQIRNDLEIGFAIYPSKPFQLWRLSLERVGIAYRRGAGNDANPADNKAKFEGFRLYFSSLFDQ
ncbi:MAG TPA: hypothetical protein PKK10_00130 [Woeseiaceae bacterium]|nr:hypothetical protein [Woeseiaceae bacterium]